MYDFLRRLLNITISVVNLRHNFFENYLKNMPMVHVKLQKKMPVV